MVITAEMRAVLGKVRDDDAFWTSDIAYDCRMQTAPCRRKLIVLEREGYVERVVKGNPTSWRRTKRGLAALAAHGDSHG